MKVYYELDLTNFEFWAGAKQRVSYLSYEELKELNNIFESFFEELSETEINDIFWFEEDWVAELLGYEDFAEIMFKKMKKAQEIKQETYKYEERSKLN